MKSDEIILVTVHIIEKRCSAISLSDAAVLTEILKGMEQDIRENQRKLDAVIAQRWLNQTDPCDIETAILSGDEGAENDQT